MAILNYMCENCDHKYVCEKKKTIDKFHADAKNNIGVDIEMKKCIDAKDINN